MASTCQRCGAALNLGASSCASCGAPVTSSTQPNNVIAALCYVGFAITGIIFLLVEPYNRDETVRFHARQSIALTVAWVAFSIVMGVLIAVLPGPLSRLFAFLNRLGDLALAVLWVFLIYQAYVGNRFRVPYLADWAEAVPF
ncbi:MAG TPA: hypothetical protein VKB84_11965 [Candidatus Binataceae bacterium]|nr:hypothetical protein [Candidatus Binataceae bacterium]